MKILKRFYPDGYVSSVYNINFKRLYNHDFRAIIFDIDNTLVPQNAPSNKEIETLLKKLMSMGYKITLLSNNKKSRVEMFNKNIGTFSIHRASEPAKRNYIKALKLMNVNPEKTVVIGDQLFTDIFGAKNVGIKTILVVPMKRKENFIIKIKRFPEKLILNKYRKRKIS